MTEVEFHTGVDDQLDFACRLLRKASRKGVRVQVTAPPELLAALDGALWSHEERDFIAHVRLPGSTAAVSARTPIWLSAAPLREGQGGRTAVPRVLINLGAPPPQDLQAFDRLVEIVGTEPDDVERGRERWRAYKAAGLSIKHHASARSD